MVGTRRLTELIEATLPRIELPTGPVLIALSGGADSAALAYITIEAGVHCSGLHVNHGFPASGMMEKAARAVASQLDIALQVESVTVPEGPSPEAMAREARYRVFDAATVPVLTGHTLDDSAETILINLTRGTGPAGLAGIPAHRPLRVYRPLLGVTRSETREIATLTGLEFADDPMNDDPALIRNRIRRQVLPMLRELNPLVTQSLARAAQTLSADADFLDRMADRFRATDAVPIGLVFTLPKPIADRVLLRLLANNGVGPTADRLARVWSVVTGESERQELASGQSVCRHGPLLVIE